MMMQSMQHTAWGRAGAQSRRECSHRAPAALCHDGTCASYVCRQQHRRAGARRAWWRRMWPLALHVRRAQAHYSSYQSSHDEDNPALGLLEDALKMPFTVFTTSQKKTMLKWHAKLTGHAADGGAAAHADAGGAHAAHAAAGEQCSVIDVAQGAIQVMNDDGDTYDIPRSVCAGELAQRIADAFERGDDVRVRVVAGSGGGRDKLIAAVL